MSKRAVLYARVSTDEQADRGYSLPSQIEECRKYAERLGYTVVGELREDYSGATPIAERPEGKKLAALLKAKQADAVIVYQVDRLSRDIVDLLATVRMWLRAGIEVHTCDIGKVESELDIVLVIKGWQGSDERKKIRERTSRGRNSKASAGRVVGSGNAPFGYGYEYVTFKPNARPVTVGLVIVEAEARIVRLIYVWYVEGDGDGSPLPLRAIARRLSEMRVPTPGELRPGIPRKRVDGMWCDATVRLILRNETYAGLWHYRKVDRCGTHSERRAPSERIAVNVPVVIDRDPWEKAQARLQYNKQMAMRNCKRQYLLRGMIRCGCGAAMIGQVVNGKYWYYVCTANPHKHTKLEHLCKERAVRCDAADQEAWGYVLNLFADRERFERALHQAQQAKLDALLPKRERLETVNGLLADCDKEAAELARAVKQVKGGVVGRKLEKQIEEVEARYTALTKERDELQAELDAKRLTNATIEAALHFREKVIVGLQNPTFEDKRKVLELLQAQMTVRDGRAKVSCVVSLYLIETMNS